MRRFLILLSCLLAQIPLFAQNLDPIQPLIERYGDSRDDRLGHDLDNAGDVNGDGTDDIIAGAPLDAGGGSRHGSVQVFSGSDGSTLYSFYGSIFLGSIGHSVCGAGDVNNDGFDDFAYSMINGGPNLSMVQVISGFDGSVIHTLTSTVFGDVFGYSLNGVGDVDADGFADLAVGAYGDSLNGPNTGRVDVFSGATGLLLHQSYGHSTRQLYGLSLAACGDLNLDGFDDIVVGSFQDSRYFPFAGSAQVISGKDGSMILNLRATKANEGMGFAVDRVGDINGDGFNDLIVGSPGYSTEQFAVGKISLFSGKDGSLIREELGRFFQDRLGHDVCGAGDVDLDGVMDYAASSHSDSYKGGKEGTVFIYSGATGKVIRHYHAGGRDRDFFGMSLANGGDQNQDGYPDLIVGSSLFNLPNQPDVGRVQVISGISAPAFPGSNTDFSLAMGINAAPTLRPDIHQVTMGDFVNVKIDSLLGQYVGQVPILFAQLFVTDFYPRQPLSYPEIYVDPSSQAPFPAVLLLDGNSNPGAPALLPSGGLAMSAQIPAGVVGFSVMVQAAVLGPNPKNPYFTASDAKELQIN